MNKSNLSGIFLVDKPTGISSAKCLSFIKKNLKIEKIGHAGTLDPLASGLLVCLAGKATRVASYAEGGAKCYSGEIKFGITTTTDDICGETISSKEVNLTIEQIKEASAHFIGSISQIPPQVSALKVNGERAYKLVRRGESVELAARNIDISQFVIESGSSMDTVFFTIQCSKGTYIRSIARDLGEMLGCGAALSTLRREGSYPFSVSSAKLPEKLTLEDMLPIDALFPSVRKIAVEPQICDKLKHGNKLALEELLKNFEERQLIYTDLSGNFCGLLNKEGSDWNFTVNL